MKMSKVFAFILAILLLVGGAVAQHDYEKRFGIFYEQRLDGGNFKLYTFHDATTGQEFVCVCTTNGSGSANSVSCHLTGRVWK